MQAHDDNASSVDSASLSTSDSSNLASSSQPPSDVLSLCIDPDLAPKRPLCDSSIVLLGDSTLDNVVWIAHEAGALSVPEHLRALTSARIHNFAADGFTSADVLNGANAVISRSARAAVGDPFPTLRGGPPAPFFAPLDALDALNSSAGERKPYGVLSVGGNDVREILGAMHRLPIALAELHDNYPRIVERALGATDGKLVIVLCYQPALDADSAYGVYAAIDSAPPLPGWPAAGVTAQRKLQALIDIAFAPILEIARKLGLAVIDLPRSLDPRNANLYRCQIEPSSEGGAIIARLIAHAIQHHDPARGSALYVLPPGATEVVVELNDGSLPPYSCTRCPM